MVHFHRQAASPYFLWFKAEVENNCLFSSWWADLYRMSEWYNIPSRLQFRVKAALLTSVTTVHVGKNPHAGGVFKKHFLVSDCVLQHTILLQKMKINIAEFNIVDARTPKLKKCWSALLADGSQNRKQNMNKSTLNSHPKQH